MQRYKVRFLLFLLCWFGSDPCLSLLSSERLQPAWTGIDSEAPKTKSNQYLQKSFSSELHGKPQSSAEEETGIRAKEKKKTRAGLWKKRKWEEAERRFAEMKTNRKKCKTGLKKDVKWKEGNQGFSRETKMLPILGFGILCNGSLDLL